MSTAFCLCSEQGSTVGQCLWKTALVLVKQILRRSTLTEGLSIENLTLPPHFNPNNKAIRDISDIV